MNYNKTNFLGYELSEREIKQDSVSYGTFIKCFENKYNDIPFNRLQKWMCSSSNDWTVFSGDNRYKIDKNINIIDKKKNKKATIYGTYTVSWKGAYMIRTYTNDIVLYSEKMDMYIWCIDFDYGGNLNLVDICIRTDEISKKCDPLGIEKLICGFLCSKQVNELSTKDYIEHLQASNRVMTVINEILKI